MFSWLSLPANDGPEPEPLTEDAPGQLCPKCLSSTSAPAVSMSRLLNLGGSAILYPAVFGQEEILSLYLPRINSRNASTISEVRIFEGENQAFETSGPSVAALQGLRTNCLKPPGSMPSTFIAVLFHATPRFAHLLLTPRLTSPFSLHYCQFSVCRLFAELLRRDQARNLILKTLLSKGALCPSPRKSIR